MARVARSTLAADRSESGPRRAAGPGTSQGPGRGAGGEAGGGFSSLGGVVPFFGLGLGLRGVGEVDARGAGVGVLPVSGSESAGARGQPDLEGVRGLPLTSFPFLPSPYSCVRGLLG